jgi:leukotriene-A4 hydrolase
LRRLPSPLPSGRMRELDDAFGLTATGNNELAFQWLLMSIRSGYAAADVRLEDFLVSIGRRKYIKPLYEELAKTPEGRERALAIYRKARPGYHPIAVDTVDRIVDWKG